VPESRSSKSAVEPLEREREVSVYWRDGKEISGERELVMVTCVVGMDGPPTAGKIEEPRTVAVDAVETLFLRRFSEGFRVRDSEGRLEGLDVADEERCCLAVPLEIEFLVR